MIKILIHKTEEGIVAFSCKGHADYADEGYDIVCAAVSILTVNTSNSVEKLTGTAMKSKQKDGNLSFQLTEKPNDKTELLLQSMLLGLRDIEEQYPKYLKVTVTDSSFTF